MQRAWRFAIFAAAVCLWLPGCSAGGDDDVATDDDVSADDDVAGDDDSGQPTDDDTGDDDTGDDDTQSSGVPAYPSVAFETVLLSGAGVCHGEGSPWGYAQNALMMSIAWKELDGRDASEIAVALGAYIDAIQTPTMLAIMMGGQTAGEPPEIFYPADKETIPGYLLNIGEQSVTPDLGNETFQQDLDTFLAEYGPGLRQALTEPSRRDKVIASIGWLGSYSECHYSSEGEPTQEELEQTIRKYHEQVGEVAEIPMVFHITGRHDIAESIAADPDLSAAIAEHHLWFKINGFHCAEEVAGDCLGFDYAETQTDVLTELRTMGANVGWEPKNPWTFFEQSGTAQQSGFDLSYSAGASFCCVQEPSFADEMSTLLTGAFQPPAAW